MQQNLHRAFPGLLEYAFPLQICCALLIFHKIARYSCKQSSDAHIKHYFDKEGPYLGIIIHQHLNMLSGALGHFPSVKKRLFCSRGK